MVDVVIEQRPAPGGRVRQAQAERADTDAEPRIGRAAIGRQTVRVIMLGQSLPDRRGVSGGEVGCVLDQSSAGLLGIRRINPTSSTAR